PRRKVGRNGDGNIVMLVRAAFTGSDLKTLFQVEKANLTAKPVLPRPLRPENPVPAPAEKSAAAEEPETPAESSDASPEEPEASKKPSQPKRPKPRRKAAKSKKRPAPVKPEYIDTPSGLRLTVDEEIALRQIAGSPEDAEAGEESDNGGASLIAAAGERNKLSREDLLTKALEDGLIDLAPLEARGNPKLTTSQEHTARLMFALEGFDERIKRLSPAGLESVHELYDALGLQPDQHALAFLIVKQAGYLED
ncbi:MAG TPA: hypothetical protein VN554_01000, partial [Verrucomicrobiae bacterium]|nr:hypothetical protein [Verrucomicrobiae bacterium]